MINTMLRSTTTRINDDSVDAEVSLPEDDVVESDGVDDEAPLEVVLEHIMSDKTYVPEGYIMGTDGSLIVDGAADKHCDMISPSDSEGIEEAGRGKRRRIANTQYGEYDAHYMHYEHINCSSLCGIGGFLGNTIDSEPDHQKMMPSVGHLMRRSISKFKFSMLKSTDAFLDPATPPSTRVIMASAIPHSFHQAESLSKANGPLGTSVIVSGDTETAGDKHVYNVD
ncbi:hypothetical protein F4604DRAFT_1905991 [Suillus subluteus]|nr:hypothetical protein F4604DRAFT_1905991 [Suillus subluteus]